jgi:hypothetical protein
MSTCPSSNSVEGRKVLSADDAKKERLIENSPNGHSTGTLTPVCARRRTPSLPCTCLHVIQPEIIEDFIKEIELGWIHPLDGSPV